MNVKTKSTYVMLAAIAVVVSVTTYWARKPVVQRVETRSEQRLRDDAITLFYNAGFTPVAPIRVVKAYEESTVTVRLVRDEIVYSGIVTCPARQPCGIRSVARYLPAETEGRKNSNQDEEDGE